MQHPKHKRLPGNMRKQLRNIRNIRFKMQNGKCYHCGTQMTISSSFENSDHYCTADHFPIPKQFGGKVDSNNIVAACKKCNQTAQLGFINIKIKDACSLFSGKKVDGQFYRPGYTIVSTPTERKELYTEGYFYRS